jgi:hypothetical protein
MECGIIGIYECFGETYCFHLQAELSTRCHNAEHTERRDRMVNTPASYLGGPGFKSRPVDRLS